MVVTIKLKNSVIRDHYSRISDLQPLVMGFLYDQMQLYLATKHKVCEFFFAIKQMQRKKVVIDKCKN